MRAKEHLALASRDRLRPGVLPRPSSLPLLVHSPQPAKVPDPQIPQIPDDSLQLSGQVPLPDQPSDLLPQDELQTLEVQLRSGVAGQVLVLLLALLLGLARDGALLAVVLALEVNVVLDEVLKSRSNFSDEIVLG